MMFLKQSTAIEVKIGPFVDQTDGFTAETGLTLAQADIRLAKEEADWAQKNETTTAVAEENGWYRCLLNATDTNTLGRLYLAVNEAGALPVWHEFMVLPASSYDAIVSETGNGVHADVRVIAANAITATSIAADAITAAKIAPDAIGASELAADAVAEIADGVWDELKAGHAVADSFGDYLDYEITSRAAPGDAMDLVAGAVDAAAIATDAIDGDALAASAVTEIQSGLATAAALATVQADTDDIQTRLPATLSAGKMRSQVEGMDAGTVTAAVVATDAIDGDAIAATAVTEIQAGLATSAALSTVQADTDDIQTRLPAALDTGRMVSKAEVVTDKTGYALTSGERDSIAAALLDLANGVETAYTLRQTLRLMAAAVASKVSGEPGAPVFRNLPDTANRITATVDASGNRTAVTHTP